MARTKRRGGRARRRRVLALTPSPGKKPTPHRLALHNAVLSVRRHLGMAKSGVSMAFIERAVAGRRGLTFDAVKGAVRRNELNGGRMHGRDLLSDADEQAVVAMVKAAAGQHAHVQPADVIGAAREVFKLGPSWRGWSWYAGIKMRYPDVFRLLKAKPIKANRVSRNVVGEMEQFLGVAAPLMESGRYPSWAIINADESLIFSNPQSVSGVRIVPAGYDRDTTMDRSNPKGCVVPFLLASGEVLCVFIVLPAKTDHRKKGWTEAEGQYAGRVVEAPRPAHGDYPIYYIFTGSGRVNAKAWTSMLEKVHACHERLWPGLEKLLLADVLDVHQELRPLLAWTRLGNRMICLPNGCTAFAQPADQYVFATFRSVLVRLMRTRGPLPAGDVGALVPIVYQALKDATSKAAVKASFAKTGIFPWSQARLLSAARKAAGDAISVSPAERAAELAAAVVFRRQAQDDPTQRAKHVKATVQKNRVYEDWELIRMGQAQEAAAQVKAAAAKEKAVAKAAKAKVKAQKGKGGRGRGGVRGSKRKKSSAATADEGSFQCGVCRAEWDGSEAWFWCEVCDAYGVCLAHDDAQELAEDHEMECEGK